MITKYQPTQKFESFTEFKKINKSEIFAFRYYQFLLELANNIFMLNPNEDCPNHPIVSVYNFRIIFKYNLKPIECNVNQYPNPVENDCVIAFKSFEECSPQDYIYNKDWLKL